MCIWQLFTASLVFLVAQFVEENIILQMEESVQNEELYGLSSVNCLERTNLPKIQTQKGSNERLFILTRTHLSL